MTDRLSEARRIVAKWEASAAKLRAEIARRRALMQQGRAKAQGTVSKGRLGFGWFDAWERQARPLAAAIGALARAEQRLAAARDRMLLARSAATRAERRAGFAATLERKAEQVIAAAPTLKDQWKKERAEEERRIKKRAKDLRKRTTKDQREPHNPLRRHRRQPSAPALPEAATFPTGPIVPYVPPAIEADAPPLRDGLLPGDYYTTRPRIIGQLLDAPRKPAKWTPDLVGDRMVAAFRTLFRLPINVWPKEAQASWPAYRHDQADAHGQTISGTLALRNRVIPGTSAEDVAMMNEALAWPMEHLRDRPDIAREVNYWARWTAWDDDERMVAATYEGLKIIAARLNEKGVVVR